MLNNQTFGVLAAARLFALGVLAVPTFWVESEESLIAILAIALLWTYQAVTAIRRELELTLPPGVEAAAIGVICAIGMDGAPTILAALVVPPLYSTLIAGPRSMPRVALVEVLTVAVIGTLWLGSIDGELSISIFTWAMAGVGLSLATGFTFAQDRLRADALRPYRQAQELIRQLIGLSDNLSSGLDPGALSGELLATVGDLLPVRVAGVYVPRGDGLTAIAVRPAASDDESVLCERLALDAWAQREIVIAGHGFAAPVGEGVLLAGLLLTDTEVELDLGAIDEARDAIAPSVVKLDTALLFAQFRDSATADERQRLAREMHDGVAQDIASLGYIVDALAAGASDERQVAQLAALRDRVTKVVSEVRTSVMNLRTSIGENESLGAAIGGVARHLSEATDIAIQVRLDEQPQRLLPEVEAELFRIAQEAINNAVKHSRANSIDVLCRVSPPDARISITDDGVGMQKARADSHGLKIMRERARLIGAHLEVRDNASRGMTVSVTLQPSRTDAN